MVLEGNKLEINFPILRKMMVEIYFNESRFRVHFHIGLKTLVFPPNLSSGNNLGFIVVIPEKSSTTLHANG
jgi:hypothetical protein